MAQTYTTKRDQRLRPQSRSLSQQHLDPQGQTIQPANSILSDLQRKWKEWAQEVNVSMPFEEGKRQIKKFFRPTFYSLFTLYTILTIFIGAGVMMAFQKDLLYIDGVYIAASAFCEVGLTSRDLSRVTASTNVVIGFIMLMGSCVLQTCIPIVLRRLYFNPATASRLELLEYQALGKLLYIIQAFYWGTLFFCFLIMVIWLTLDQSGLAILTKYNNSAMGWSAFVVISSFMSNGLTTLPDGLIEFFAYPVPLLVLSYSTLVGETMYPIMLRFIVWVLYKFSSGADRRLYRFILAHPRRLYTNLFSWVDTMWLLLVVIGVDALEFLFLTALNWNGPAFSFMTGPQKILNAFFMATTTRTSGFNSINITALSYGMLALYCGTMYLSVTPVFAIMRRSKVGKWKSSITGQAKQLLVQDAFYLFIIFVLVCAIESERIYTDPNFTAFAIIFEIITAYGTVGLSFGYPTNPNSFSGVWSPFSKFLISLAMILGRLRGVPLSDERSIHIRPRSIPLTNLNLIPDEPEEAGPSSAVSPAMKKYPEPYRNFGDHIIEMQRLHSRTTEEEAAESESPPRTDDEHSSNDPTKTGLSATSSSLSTTLLSPKLTSVLDLTSSPSKVSVKLLAYVSDKTKPTIPARMYSEDTAMIDQLAATNSDTIQQRAISYPPAIIGEKPNTEPAENQNERLAVLEDEKMPLEGSEPKRQKKAKTKKLVDIAIDSSVSADASSKAKKPNKPKAKNSRSVSVDGTEYIRTSQADQANNSNLPSPLPVSKSPIESANTDPAAAESAEASSSASSSSKPIVNQPIIIAPIPKPSSLNIALSNSGFSSSIPSPRSASTTVSRSVSTSPPAIKASPSQTGGARKDARASLVSLPSASPFFQSNFVVPPPSATAPYSLSKIPKALQIIESSEADDVLLQWLHSNNNSTGTSKQGLNENSGTSSFTAPSSSAQQSYSYSGSNEGSSAEASNQSYFSNNSKKSQKPPMSRASTQRSAPTRKSSHVETDDFMTEDSALSDFEPLPSRRNKAQRQPLQDEINPDFLTEDSAFYDEQEHLPPRRHFVRTQSSFT